MFHTLWGTSSAHADVPGWISGLPVLPWTLSSLLYDGTEKTPLIAVILCVFCCSKGLVWCEDVPWIACCLELILCLPSFVSQTKCTTKIQVSCVSTSQHSEGTSPLKSHELFAQQHDATHHTTQHHNSEDYNLNNPCHENLRNLTNLPYQQLK